MGSEMLPILLPMEDSDRAARLIDMMARDGLLGPAQGSKPREVLVKPDYFQEIDDSRMGVEEDE